MKFLYKDLIRYNINGKESFNLSDGSRVRDDTPKIKSKSKGKKTKTKIRTITTITTTRILRLTSYLISSSSTLDIKNTNNT